MADKFDSLIIKDYSPIYSRGGKRMKRKSHKRKSRKNKTRTRRRYH